MLFGQEGGSFAQPLDYEIIVENGMAITDFDEDGYPDVAASGHCTNASYVSLLLGQGDSGLENPTLFETGNVDAQHIATGDMDLDGHEDAVVAFGGENQIGILFGDGNGSLESPIVFDTDPASTLNSNWVPHFVALADVNADGFLDILATYSTGFVSVLLSVP